MEKLVLISKTDLYFVCVFMIALVWHTYKVLKSKNEIEKASEEGKTLPKPYNQAWFAYLVFILIIAFVGTKFYIVYNYYVNSTVAGYKENAELVLDWLIYLSGVLMLIIVYKSCNIVKANEFGVKIFMGIPVTAVDPGFNLTFWPLYVLERFPANQQVIDFVVPSIMTRRGRVKGSNDIIEPAEINIVMKLFYYFDKNLLTKTIKRIPGKSEEKMSEPLIGYLTDVVRNQAGKVPWRLINQERFKFLQIVRSRIIPITVRPSAGDNTGEPLYKINPQDKDEKIPTFAYEEIYEGNENVLKAKDLKGSPFVQFGLKNVDLSIIDINFTDEELKKAISAPETSRLKANAKRNEGDGERYYKEQVGIGEAEARKAMIEAIKENPDLEVLFALREMARGTSNTILYQVPAAFENRMRDLLGGNSLGDAVRMFSPENQQYLKKIVEEIITELAKKSSK